MMNKNVIAHRMNIINHLSYENGGYLNSIRFLIAHHKYSVNALIGFQCHYVS